MPRVPVHTVHGAPDGSRDDLKALEAQFGTVLNLFGEMAHAPTFVGTEIDVPRAPALDNADG